jgi:hypothetical protein
VRAVNGYGYESAAAVAVQRPSNHQRHAGPFANIANVIMPCVLEVTLASRGCYQFEESNVIFPTPLDQPNLPSQPEMRLGSFRF